MSRLPADMPIFTPPPPRPRAQPAANRPSGLSPLTQVWIEDQPRMFVPPDIVRRAADANAGLLLACICFWFQPAEAGAGTGFPRARAFSGNQRWLAMTGVELEIATGLSPSQVKRGLGRLLGSGIVVRDGRSERLRLREPIEAETRGVMVLAGTVRLAGNAARALVLSQIDYWHADGQDGQTRLRHRRDGQWWLAKTHAELSQETGLPERQVRSSLDRLTRAGLIHKSVHRFRGRPAVFMRLDSAAFLAAWQEQHDRWLLQLVSPRYCDY